MLECEEGLCNTTNVATQLLGSIDLATLDVHIAILLRQTDTQTSDGDGGEAASE